MVEKTDKEIDRMAFLTLTREEKLSFQGLAVRCVGIPYYYHTALSQKELKGEPEALKLLSCSQFTKYLYYKLGYWLPDGAIFQYNASKPTSTLEIGDCAYKRSKGVISHIGIVISVAGDTPLIAEASGTFKRVIIRPLSEFKVYPRGPEYAGVRRFLLDKITSPLK